jgi:hypothetical protein
MTAVGFLALMLFDTILSIVEIPKMLSGKLYKELIAFSVLLFFGTILAVIQLFDMKIPNPSDWIAWVFSPLEEFMKNLTKS